MLYQKVLLVFTDCELLIFSHLNCNYNFEKAKNCFLNNFNNNFKNFKRMFTKFSVFCLYHLKLLFKKYYFKKSHKIFGIHEKSNFFEILTLSFQLNKVKN